MALQPSLKSLIIAGSPGSPHTLELFLDYVCPFSRKMTLVVNSVLKPLFDEGGKYSGKVKVIFRNQVQPWHASSTFVHEAGIAVARAAPEKFWAFSVLLMERQEEFYDIPTSTMTPLQIREKLAEVASQAGLTSVQVKAFSDALALKGSPNGGVSVTDELKYTIKISRQNGIHVSPTVLWDGLVANEISSSWGSKEWADFLANKVIAQ
ncbi:thioredoxin-like protein [Vararia minispora EC-137]|uniref:Thioredoxin-like protein n=1 Tax=Vararia minispora EC-137 TaxID=1314806 RepID=A0ACB8QNJ5_9AGAM|nr:thioredoxin-like protein [Vararia minispora EC-137]